MHHQMTVVNTDHVQELKKAHLAGLALAFFFRQSTVVILETFQDLFVALFPQVNNRGS